MDWQPIETAPKDGSLVLLYIPKIAFQYFNEAKSNIFAGYFNAGFRDRWITDLAEPYPSGEGYDDYDALEVHPTHWAPYKPPQS